VGPVRLLVSAKRQKVQARLRGRALQVLISNSELAF
jgi:hypothetical protein